ncbi:GRIP and coiled-coil domain-containing protein 2 isoform X2 [Scyliorhinus canicula]|uniref:GRIP and coiled-coil domain-containing protein 2 isoform X2 n=1 Tax=Scyliorhinus canicula TaxID=7830 RepID=UPI0018F63321|nr:GRIP and coiled-coil domain-containing protein 2 isoform X2 [Scyliorhinus canicula]
MEESSQDGVPSPATPGTGKSKLDTLPKEDLIKFAKKQVMLLQKTKSKCTALENEIEQLKTKSTIETNDAVLQELTTRLDSLLLEKAEAQQSAVSLQKEIEKNKEELKDAISRATEFQEEMKLLKNQHLNKLEALYGEMEAACAKHTEDVTRLENELQASKVKHNAHIGQLEQQLEIYSAQQTEAKRLREELDAVKIASEDQILQLKKQLDASAEKQKEEIRSLQENNGDSVEKMESEMKELQQELRVTQVSRHEEVTTLKQQFESAVKVHDEELKKLEQDLTKKHTIKEKSLENEAITNRTNYEHQLNRLEQQLRKMIEEQNEVRKEIPNETASESSEQMKYLENYVKKLELQQSLLQDELSYIKETKEKLETELYHTKEEFFHEREDWEFKINELQLTKEEFMNMVTKLTEELQLANDRCEMAVAQHSCEMQMITEQHEQDISILELNLATAAERKKVELLLEIDNLNKQCEALLEEKVEIQYQYENLRKTMEILQTELGESASKISYEFEAMKKQQFDEIHDLQQKLRRIFNENDSLLETKNRLQAEVEEAEELKQTVSNFQEKNQELTSLIQTKEANLNDLHEQVGTLIREKEELVTTRKDSEELVNSLKQSLVVEQGKCAEFQQQIQALDKGKYELQQRLDEIACQLEEAISEKESTFQKLGDMENKLGALITEKEHLDSQTQNLEDFITKLEKEKEALQKDVAMFNLQNENLGENEEKLQDLNKQLQILTRERDDLQLADKIAEQKLCDVRLAIINIIEQEVFSFTNDGPELDIIEAVQLLEKSVTKIREEKQSAVMQCNERILHLQQELELQNTAYRDQQAELSCLIDDLRKERALLQKHLDEALLDKEGLQRDLLELQNLSEKITQENENLLIQIQNVTEKLENVDTEKQEQDEKTGKEATEEKEEQLKCQLNEKESELSNLKEELQKLKDLMQETSNEENSLQSTIVELNQKIVALEKVNNDKENRINKIKAVAVKAKKELDISKKQVLQLTEEIEIVKSERDRLSSSVKDIMQGAESYKNLLLEYEKQGEKLDIEKERANNCERQVEELTQHLHGCVQQHKQLASDKEDMVAHLGTLQSNARQLETKILESEKAKVAVEKELEVLKHLKEQASKENHALLKEVEELKKQLQNEKHQLHQTAQELELVRKDAQKSTLMDMEIADYERFVKELNQKITDRDNRIVKVVEEMTSCKQKLETMECEIKSLQATLEEHKEKNTKMKQILVKTKKELADSKRAEGEQSALQASFKGELEASQQQVENYKIQVAELTAENHKFQEQLRQVNEQNHRTMSAFTQKMAALQEECSIAKAEQNATAVDFESYKVRVHNVLKQQKSRSAAQNEHELTQQEKEHLQKVVDQLKAKLQETQCNLQVNVGELQALQLEHDMLLERHNKILQETVSKEAEIREKLCCVQSENVLLKSEHAQTVSQMIAQNEAAHQSFRDQVRHLQEDHRKTVETLQKQLTKMEAQILQFQSENNLANPLSLEPSSGKTLRDRRNMDISVLDINSIDRGEGEGMEMTETESVSSTGTQVASLEQLLTSPATLLDVPQWQPEPTKEEITQKLSTATKSIDHLNGLLRETEATNAILMEQITLLKNEVRRLERNQEREKSIANLEYLKNVMLKFIFLNAGSEKQSLLPVIDTMLQMSPEEKNKLAAIAQGEDESASRSSGWVSYFHGWSGLG